MRKAIRNAPTWRTNGPPRQSAWVEDDGFGGKRGELPMTKRGDARSPKTALVVDGVSEERPWIEAHPCKCGGSWQFVRQTLLREQKTKKTTRMTDQIEVRCSQCHCDEKLFFVVVYDPPL